MNEADNTGRTGDWRTVTPEQLGELAQFLENDPVIILQGRSGGDRIEVTIGKDGSLKWRSAILYVEREQEPARPEMPPTIEEPS